MTRCEPAGAFAEGRLFQVLFCAWCDSTEDVEPIYDPWDVFVEHVCGGCLSGQEGPSFEDSMCAAYPLLDGTERY